MGVGAFRYTVGMKELVLYHHPFTRAANAVWMLEEVGCEYRLEHVDLEKGEHKREALLKLNPMGKLPTLVDDEVVVSEGAAIGLYLADRYALGRLAPDPESPERAAYLRWSMFAPSVIEPGCMAQFKGWEYAAAQAGWGDMESVVRSVDAAIGDGPWILGDTFSMADMIFGGTVRWMVRFGMLASNPKVDAYIDRLNNRPASIEAKAINAKIAEERGLNRS